MIKKSGIFSFLLIILLMVCLQDGFSIGLTRITTMGTTDIGLGSDPCEGFPWFPDNSASRLQLHYDHFLEIETRTIIPEFTYENRWKKQYKSKNNDIYMAPAISYTQRINEFSLWGIDIHVNYGYGAQFEGIWDVVDSKIMVAGVYIKPFYSSKVTEQLSIGGGPMVVMSKTNWDGNLGFYNHSFPIETELDGFGYGLGFQVGAMYQISEKLAIGMNYLSSAKINLKGDFGIFIAKLGRKKNTELEIEFPDNFDLSIGYVPRKNWLLVGQITYYGHSYNTLHPSWLIFNDLPMMKPIRLDWQGNLAFYMGISRKINEQWAVGGGISYMSESLSNSSNYFTPDINGWALGSRLKYSPTDKFSIIGSVLYCWGDGDIFLNRIKTEIWTFGITANWHF